MRCGGNTTTIKRLVNPEGSNSMCSQKILVEVEFFIEHRVNVHTPKGKEWALNVRTGNQDKWTISTWNQKPSDLTVNNTIKIFSRAIKFWNSRPAIVEVPTFIQLN